MSGRAEVSTTRWGDWYRHYPVGFDGGRALDCKTCGLGWPCAKATESAKGSAEKEAKQSSLSDSGSDEMHYSDCGAAGGFPHPASACGSSEAP